MLHHRGSAAPRHCQSLDRSPQLPRFVLKGSLHPWATSPRPSGATDCPWHTSGRSRLWAPPDGAGDFLIRARCCSTSGWARNRPPGMNSNPSSGSVFVPGGDGGSSPSRRHPQVRPSAVFQKDFLNSSILRLTRAGIPVMLDPPGSGRWPPRCAGSSWLGLSPRRRGGCAVAPDRWCVSARWRRARLGAPAVLWATARLAPLSGGPLWDGSGSPAGAEGLVYFPRAGGRGGRCGSVV